MEDGSVDLVEEAAKTLTQEMAKGSWTMVQGWITRVFKGDETKKQKALEELEREVHDHAGRTFNVGSGPQLQQVLFEELGLPKTRRIKTGYSTDASAMQALLGQHPIVEAVLELQMSMPFTDQKKGTCLCPESATSTSSRDNSAKRSPASVMMLRSLPVPGIDTR
jgi:hypothetical protein